MRKLLATAIPSILASILCNNVNAQQVNAFAEFDGSTLALPTMKFGDKIYENLKLSHVQGLEFAYQSNFEEIFSDQKTNSIFDGEKLIINLVKSSNHLYSNLILIPNS
jgi:hypothetical protein